MNNLETWTKYDTYFIIVSSVISFIIIGVGLMRYSNLLVKFIFFGIVASLLFFLFRYLKNANIIFTDYGEVWHPNNKYSDTIVSSENTYSDPSPKDKIEEFTSSEYEPTKFTLKGTSDNKFTVSNLPSPVLATTDEVGIISEEEEYMHSEVKETDNYLYNQQMRMNKIQQVRLRGSPTYTTVEEEGQTMEEEGGQTMEEEVDQTMEEEDCIREEDGECKQFIDHKKKVPTDGPSINKHIGIPDRSDKNTMSPYQSPVNINVSYISKNSVSDSNFAKDDIVTNSKLGTPGNNFYGNSRPSDMNQRLTIDNNNENSNSNNNYNRNSNSNYNRNNNENCIGPGCRGSQPLPVPDQAYTNSGYSYLNSDYQGLDSDTTSGSCNNEKCHVCPMEINQNWSEWNPNYLSGDDTKINK